MLIALLLIKLNMTIAYIQLRTHLTLLKIIEHINEILACGISSFNSIGTLGFLSKIRAEIEIKK